MYIVNNIAHANKPECMLEIINVKVLDGMLLLLTFNTGEQRIFDAALLTGPAFEPLKEPKVFKEAAILHGTVSWMGGAIDCAPEYMYQNSVALDDNKI